MFYLKTNPHAFDLQRFAEGAGVSSPSAASADSGNLGAVTESTTAEGGQGSENTGDNSSVAGNDRKAAYARMKSDFKDLYDEDVGNIVKHRIKGQSQLKEQNKQLSERISKQDGLMSLLAAKYGTNDTDALYEAFLNDDSQWAAAAEREDLSPQKYAEMVKLKAKNSKLEGQVRRIEAETAARAQYVAWEKEANALKEEFPDFDLMAELQNPKFRSLISTRDDGVRFSMKDAYRHIHMDEILSQAKKKATSAVIDDVRARGMRPAEAGANTQDGMSVSVDVGKLTKEQRADLAERALRGEAIPL